MNTDSARTRLGLTGCHARPDRFSLSVVVPCFNEEEVISATYHRLVAVLGNRDFDLQVVFVVDGIRTKRKESLLKRGAYKSYYKIFQWLANIDAPLDAGDFSLIDRQVLDVINQLPERNRFFRGLRAWSGFRQVGIAYERDPRA